MDSDKVLLGVPYTPSPWLMRFLGLAKIRSSQIRSTEVISNQKRMSEGIPLLM